MDLERAGTLLRDAERASALSRSRLVEELAVLATFDRHRLDGAQAGSDVLRLLCQPMPSSAGDAQSVLSEADRIAVLATLLGHGGRRALEEVRLAAAPDFDTPLQRRLDAFVFDEPAQVGDLDEDDLLAALEVWRWATEAVARAGLSREIVVSPTREQIESRLALLGVTRAVRRLAEQGCVGREAELARLHEYRTAPSASSLAQDPPLVVYGVGGVGKSTLVARFVVDLYERQAGDERWAWAYLDLDRPTLASCDPGVLLADIAEQVSAQFPDYRRGLQRAQYIKGERTLGAGLESVTTALSYRQWVAELADAMAAAGAGSLRVVLDTYEELERNHPERGKDLYGLFSSLASAVPGFRLIVSGRAPASDFLHPPRTDRQLHVLPLEGESALTLLRTLIEQEADLRGRQPPEIGADLGREIVELVGGIPLTLRLAAQVISQEGADAVVDAAHRGRALDRVRSELIRGFLYQRILNHITAPDARDTSTLRQLARASVILRSISVELIERVLMPAAGTAPDVRADVMFSALASEVALVQRDGSTLRLREELRGPALMALKLEDQGLVQRVHQFAKGFYSTADATGEDRLELAYHRLAAGEPASHFDEDVLRKLWPSLVELPPSSAQVITNSLSNPTALAQARELELWEEGVLSEGETSLLAGDLQRVHALLEGRPDRPPQTQLHRLESRLAEAEGRLEDAAYAAGQDLAAAWAAADPRRAAACAVRVAGLYERLGRPSQGDEVIAHAAEAALLGGAPELRLELVLNRMNLRERRGLDSDDSRWTLELDARALIRSSDPKAMAANTALLRLLAAALGADEPVRLQEAVRALGVGFDEDPVRVRELVRTLAEWDAGQDVPGRLARMVGSLSTLRARVASSVSGARSPVWGATPAASSTACSAPNSPPSRCARRCE